MCLNTWWKQASASSIWQMCRARVMRTDVPLKEGKDIIYCLTCGVWTKCRVTLSLLSQHWFYFLLVSIEAKVIFLLPLLPWIVPDRPEIRGQNSFNFLTSGNLNTTTNTTVTSVMTTMTSLLLGLYRFVCMRTHAHTCTHTPKFKPSLFWDRSIHTNLLVTPWPLIL